MLHSRYFEYEKTKPVFRCAECELHYANVCEWAFALANEQAYTKSKDQIELKLFSCAQMLKKKKKKQHVAAF